MTPTKVKMKSDSDNDSLNSFKSNRSSHSDRIIQLEEEFKSVKAEFKAMEIGFNEKFDRILNYLDALNLCKKDDSLLLMKARVVFLLEQMILTKSSETPTFLHNDYDNLLEHTNAQSNHF